MNSIVQIVNRFLYFSRQNRMYITQKVSGITKHYMRFFSGSLLSNTALILSVSMHLIGASIIGLSSIKSTSIQTDSMYLDFISSPTPKRILTVLPKEKSVPQRVHPKSVKLQRLSQKKINPILTKVKTELQPIAATTYDTYLGGVYGLHEPKSALAGLQVPLNTEIMKSQEYVSSVNLIPQRNKRNSEFVSPELYRIQLTSIPLNVPNVVKPTQDAKFRKKIEPIYPDSAKFTHKQGLVVLEATIGVDGKAHDIRVVEVLEISGLGCEEAAIQALKSSIFTPALQGKVVISQRIRIPYRFNLNG